ncbi:MAG: Rieske (2Fe-2S) protein [Acidobacteriales bacterium]|nr:Rieske (2Fe-2S) protein [Terriglobales bacterium]
MCAQECKECKKKPAQWRDDFPIEWEKDQYVTRREMVKFLTLGSAFLVLANGVLAAVGRFTHPGKTSRRSVALASAVPLNSSVLFRYPTDEDPCILVHTREGGFVAYSQVCTHLSCAVIHRPEQDTLYCPCHQGFFNIQTGDPTAGPPTRRLPRVALQQDGDVIFAAGMEV